VRGHLVILIAFIAFEGTEIDESSSGHRLIVMGVFGRDLLDAHIGAIRCFEVVQPHNTLAIGKEVHRAHAGGLMGNAVEAPLRERHWLCGLVHAGGHCSRR
jgi:hypothetical protein